MSEIQCVFPEDRACREQALRAVEKLALDGHTNREISVRLNLHRRVVGRLRRELWKEWLNDAAQSRTEAGPSPLRGIPSSIARQCMPGGCPE